MVLGLNVVFGVQKFEEMLNGPDENVKARCLSVLNFGYGVNEIAVLAIALSNSLNDLVVHRCTSDGFFN